jgi:CheY-like chemotaxis protein
MRIPAADKGLTLDVSVDPSLPAIIRGDVTALRQVLSNVIGNAVKFTESGGVKIAVKLEKETETHQIVRFDVSDSGIGIAADQIGGLFQPFHQVDGSMTRKYGGVGLGLATARHLVELMGGLMGVESEVLEGSTFWFTIPFEKRISQRLAVSSSKLDLTGARVLVADKNPTSRRIVTHYLKSELRMRCDTATGLPQALWMISSAAELGDPYNVAVFDLHMPVMHGVALAKEVKGRPMTASTALVAMTSFGEEVDDEMLREVGIAAYLSKPVELDELLDCLTLAMAREMRPAPVVSAVPAAAPPLAAADDDAEVRVLLAEDNRLNQKLTSSQLMKLGYEVDVVSNGREVIEALTRRHYRIILMDCQMPELDGYQATIEIRRREGKERKTRIIAMTAHALEGDREKCLAAGMDDYLSKPTREADLADALARWSGSDE